MSAENEGSTRGPEETSGQDAAGAPQKPKFSHDSGFYKELKRRVDGYFAATQLARRGGPRMYLKSAVILSWFVVSYAGLVFGASTWWQAVPLAISLALAVAGIGFAIQHDANHGSYSSNERINRLMGITLDLLGASLTSGSGSTTSFITPTRT